MLSEPKINRVKTILPMSLLAKISNEGIKNVTQYCTSTAAQKRSKADTNIGLTILKNLCATMVQKHSVLMQLSEFVL